VEPQWKLTPISSLFYLSSRFPSKGALIEMPHLQSSFSHLSKSLIDKPTPGCLTEPPERELPVPEPWFYNPGSPLKEPSLETLTGSLFRERRPFLEPTFYLSFRVPSKGALQVPFTELPQREKLHLQSPFQLYLKVPAR
jgi:hypothetical protein